MSVLALQTNLKAAGFDPGPLDNDFGGKTLGAEMSFAARRDLGDKGRALALAMAPQFALADISNRQRIIHAVAQACHESGGFRYMEELGGPSYFARYDGRADLGNTQPGDGARFHGRGIIQVTGRANYRRYGDRLGIDLIAHPERAAEPDIAAAIFCAYWTDRHLNAKADADDLSAITKAINGGYNGLAERAEIVRRLKAVWPA
jgi:putative chitinase